MRRKSRPTPVQARKIFVAAYVRMSSDKQDTSPDQQRDHIETLAKRNNFEIVRWYEDLGISGDDIHRRAEFKRMIADASAGAFQKILCWSQDRFGRFDSIEAGEWVAPLRRAGVNLLTVADGEINWSDAIGRLIYTIQQEGKHTFLVDLARSIARAAHRRAHQPGYYVGTTPYGYDKLVLDERGKCQRRITPQDKLSRPAEWTVQLVPSTDKVIVRTVRWMFRAADRGMSIRGIAVSLNKRGIPSPTGKRWQTTAVRIILVNPVYAGDQVWNRRHKGRYIVVQGGEMVSAKSIRNEANKALSRDTAIWAATNDWVIVRDAHPALVDRRIVDRVRKALMKRTHPSRGPGDAPLRGLVVCGHCGARMTIDNHRHSVLGGVAYYPRLKCPTAHVRGTSVCGYRSISHPKFLRFILDLMLARVLDDQIEARFRAHLQPTQEANRKNHLDGSQKSASAGARSLRRSPDQTLAEVMARVARYRIAFLGSDPGLIREALQQLIERIEIRFGRHPRIKRASKILTGTVQLRNPFADLSTNEKMLQFTREDFDRSVARLRAP